MGVFIVNGTKFQVETGDIISISPNDKHEVVNNTDDDFIYIAFKANYGDNDLFWD